MIEYNQTKKSTVIKSEACHSQDWIDYPRLNHISFIIQTCCYFQAIPLQEEMLEWIGAVYYYYVLSSNIINGILTPQGTIIKPSFLLAFSNISFIFHLFFTADCELSFFHKKFDEYFQGHQNFLHSLTLFLPPQAAHTHCCASTT